MKLLDSDTCIGLLRGRAEVLARRSSVVEEIATSWVTAAELFYGASRSRRPAENAALVSTFLATLPVLAPDLASARIFGEVKARLVSSGQVVADSDLFIASLALSQSATLVTGNLKHYARIPGLVIENWLRDAAGGASP